MYADHDGLGNAQSPVSTFVLLFAGVNQHAGLVLKNLYNGVLGQRHLSATCAGL
jgi:hypothetical protein